MGAGVDGVRRVDARAYQQKQIHDEDRDENKAADEDVGTESHDGFVFWEDRGRDVFVLVVAFVMMFGHADKLTSPKPRWTRREEIILLLRSYAASLTGQGQGRPGLAGDIWMLGCWSLVAGTICLPGFEEYDGGRTRMIK